LKFRLYTIFDAGPGQDSLLSAFGLNGQLLTQCEGSLQRQGKSKSKEHGGKESAISHITPEES
jgi:hypothetical protein